MSESLPKVIVEDLGRISFKEAWDYQTTLQQDIIKTKRAGNLKPDSYLLFCEHNPVYTLGKSGSADHLLLDVENNPDFEYFKINRGGDITYHGPGQLTVYPIFDLDQFYNDVHKYVRMLEEIVIQVLDTFGINGKRIEGFTGVWIDEAVPIERKICAIGVHLSRWVSLHGLALNVNTDLSHFEHIVPCGISAESKTVTSMQAELGKPLEIDVVKNLLVEKFATEFDFDTVLPVISWLKG